MKNLNQPDRGGPQSMFTNSVKWFANVLAVIAAFLGTPPLHQFSVGFIENYASDHYGPAFAEPVGWAWFALVSLAIFFISRATLSTALVMGALMLASRFAF